MSVRAISSRRCWAAASTPRFSALNSATSRWTKAHRELFFIGNEVKNSWGTLATTDKLIKENPKMIGGFMRAAIKALRYMRQDKEENSAAMIKFANVSRQQANRVYDDIIPTFTRSGMVDDETQRNDLSIIRQVINGNETLPIAKGYDFSFTSEADARA